MQIFSFILQAAFSFCCFLGCVETFGKNVEKSEPCTHVLYIHIYNGILFSNKNEEQLDQPKLGCAQRCRDAGRGGVLGAGEGPG